MPFVLIQLEGKQRKLVPCLYSHVFQHLIGKRPITNVKGERRLGAMHTKPETAGVHNHFKTISNILFRIVAKWIP